MDACRRTPRRLGVNTPLEEILGSEPFISSTGSPGQPLSGLSTQSTRLIGMASETSEPSGTGGNRNQTTWSDNWVWLCTKKPRGISRSSVRSSMRSSSCK
ncbi:hypothetical protein RJ55_03004 [Drechmeria coniospora]|nr:hypothetical protein RJ55_03004 [Drechmeria coniospora]